MSKTSERLHITIIGDNLYTTRDLLGTFKKGSPLMPRSTRNSMQINQDYLRFSQTVTGALIPEEKPALVPASSYKDFQTRVGAETSWYHWRRGVEKAWALQHVNFPARRYETLYYHVYDGVRRESGSSIIVGSDAIVLCISTERGAEQALKEWLPAVNDQGRDLPRFVVGIKDDGKGKKGSKLKHFDGPALAKQIGALEYLECNLANYSGVEYVFQMVAWAACQHRIAKSRKRRSMCIVA